MTFMNVIQMILALAVVIFGIQIYRKTKENEKRQAVLRRKELDLELGEKDQEIDAADLCDIVNRANERNRASFGSSSGSGNKKG